MDNEFKASEIDEKFDNGEDVSKYFDLDNPIIQGPQIETPKNTTEQVRKEEKLQYTYPIAEVSNN